MGRALSKRSDDLIWTDTIEYYVEVEFPDFTEASSDPLRAMDDMERILLRYGEEYKWKMYRVMSLIHSAPYLSIRQRSSFLDSLRDQVIEWFSQDPDQREHEYPLSGNQIKGAYKWVEQRMGIG